MAEQPLMGVISTTDGEVVTDFSAETTGTPPLTNVSQIIDLDALPDAPEDDEELTEEVPNEPLTPEDIEAIGFDPNALPDPDDDTA